MPKLKAHTFPHTNLQYLEIDGKFYVIGKSKEKNARSKSKCVVTAELTRIKPKEYKKLIEDVAEKLKGKINVKELVQQALKDSPVSEVGEMQKELEKPKPFVRCNRGCLTLSVGKNQLRLRD